MSYFGGRAALGFQWFVERSDIPCPSGPVLQKQIVAVNYNHQMEYESWQLTEFNLDGQITLRQ